MNYFLLILFSTITDNSINYVLELILFSTITHNSMSEPEKITDISSISNILYPYASVQQPQQSDILLLIVIICLVCSLCTRPEHKI